MGDVRISVNGQGYTIKVSDGEEPRLLELAAFFNSHVDHLAAEHGHIAESRLLILAGIRICEELFDLKNSEDAEAERLLAQNLSALAERIEACAARLGATPRNEDPHTA